MDPGMFHGSFLNCSISQFLVLASVVEIDFIKGLTGNECKRFKDPKTTNSCSQTRNKHDAQVDSQRWQVDGPALGGSAFMPMEQ